MEITPLQKMTVAFSAIIFVTTCILQCANLVCSSHCRVSLDHQVAVVNNWREILKHLHIVPTYPEHKKRYFQSKSTQPFPITTHHNSITITATFWWSLQNHRWLAVRLITLKAIFAADVLHTCFFFRCMLFRGLLLMQLPLHPPLKATCIIDQEVLVHSSHEEAGW